MKKQRRNLLSVCVALALSGNSWAETDVMDKNTQVKCPANISALPKDQQAQLLAACQKEDSFLEENWEWAAGGVAAIASAVGIAVYNDDDGDNNHSNNGGDTPPDDGGNTPTPPDDGGDSPTPPDDGGNTPTPPDDGGDSPTPPDDGGDTPTPPDTSVKQYNNGVTVDHGQDTVTIQNLTIQGQNIGDVVFQYSPVNGGSYVLTTPNGEVLNVDKWSVTADNNAVFSGTTAKGQYWIYDSKGNFVQASQGTEILSDDDAVNTRTTDTTASGTNQTGVIISGDNTTNTIGGATAASDGATGYTITGDGSTNTFNGDISSDNATAIVVSGDDTRTMQNGDLLVTNGGRGIVVDGNRTQTSNAGHTTVKDNNSVGFLISGDDARFSNSGVIDVSLNGTGAEINGNGAQTTLGGDINVISAQDAQNIFRGATGIDISGQNSTTNITGNVNVQGQYGNDDTLAGSQGDTLTGMNISGSGNTINLSGALNVNIDDQTIGKNENLSTVGLNVTGDGNSVNVSGGFNLEYTNINADGDEPVIMGISIDGDSNVTLSGQSSVMLNTYPGDAVFLADVANGGSLVLDQNSSVDVSINYLNTIYIDEHSLLNASGDGSSIENQGAIASDGVLPLLTANKGARVGNSGDIIAVVSPDKPSTRSVLVRAQNEGSVAENKAGGTITLTSAQTPVYGGADHVYPVVWYESSFYAMVANNGGEAINDQGGKIVLNGSGLYGLGASVGTAVNNGEIDVNGYQTVLDADNNITDAHYWQGSKLYETSSAMLAGSTDTGGGDATALNTGVITVHNAGFGMMALNGGTAINQGTINLEGDPDSAFTTPNNSLVGMAAMLGGVVLNDTTGIININADYGQAFYNDGSGYIINRGAINLNGNAIDETSDPAHTGAEPTDKDWLVALTGSTETDEKSSTNGFFTSEALANYGVETLNGDLNVNSWLYNKDSGTLTINGVLNVANMENGGLMTVDEINTSSRLYNRESGNLRTKALYLSGDSSFFNEGNFSGQIIGNSYKQEIVNTGAMTNNVDGQSVMSGDFALYNQAGGVISNSGQAVSGGENTLVNLTRTSSTIAQVNSGTLLATNGYSAITTAGTGSHNADKWIWNTETGVITGINPEAPLINLGSGYNFSNDGVINVQGDSAIAVQGANSGYTINLVNSGEINVGTEQGKIDGTNGEGLIGIKGNGGKTIINNTADGVINIYADNSYAFGGKAQKIINNGEINLLCDAGCGIYAPGTTGTQYDHDGTADVTVPDANTAPGQGNVPTPPADPDAPQMLSNYIVGTNANGSAGTLKANNLVIGDNVMVDTGFSAGTADTTVVVNDVFTGSDIQGVNNITSTSVVWNAQGNTDTSGNVDVTMTKNAYTAVVNDSSVNSVASALDAGYTNNALYNSLNLATSADVTKAMKQISGSMANSVSRDARVLSNRFDMLADTAPVMKNGLAFNVVAQGDKRAELGNDTKYDMMALRQTLAFGSNQTLSMEYGIARINGDNTDISAGDNGVTGGYSQFFGLTHEMPLGENGLSWNNALRYDVHQFDSSRAISYGDVNETAKADTRQQYMEFRTEGRKTFTIQEGFSVVPYAGVKLRHTIEDGYQERGAGDFNLNMSSSTETAVDTVVGMQLTYAGKNGWAANVTLEGGPNLSYASSGKTAMLQGATGQRFKVEDGQSGGGINSKAQVGVKYSAGNTSAGLDAFHWKEDGLSDKGLMLNYKVNF